jgi:hypothetical protein
LERFDAVGGERGIGAKSLAISGAPFRAGLNAGSLSSISRITRQAMGMQDG